RPRDRRIHDEAVGEPVTSTHVPGARRLRAGREHVGDDDDPLERHGEPEVPETINGPDDRRTDRRRRPPGVVHHIDAPGAAGQPRALHDDAYRAYPGSRRRLLDSTGNTRGG